MIPWSAAVRTIGKYGNVASQPYDRQHDYSQEHISRAQYFPHADALLPEPGSSLQFSGPIGSLVQLSPITSGDFVQRRGMVAPPQQLRICQSHL